MSDWRRTDDRLTLIALIRAEINDDHSTRNLLLTRESDHRAPLDAEQFRQLLVDAVRLLAARVEADADEHHMTPGQVLDHSVRATIRKADTTPGPS